MWVFRMQTDRIAKNRVRGEMCENTRGHVLECHYEVLTSTIRRKKKKIINYKNTTTVRCTVVDCSAYKLTTNYHTRDCTLTQWWIHHFHVVVIKIIIVNLVAFQLSEWNCCVYSFTFISTGRFFNAQINNNGIKTIAFKNY